MSSAAVVIGSLTHKTPAKNASLHVYRQTVRTQIRLLLQESSRKFYTKMGGSPAVVPFVVNLHVFYSVDLAQVITW